MSGAAEGTRHHGPGLKDSGSHAGTQPSVVRFPKFFRKAAFVGFCCCFNVEIPTVSIMASVDGMVGKILVK